MTSAHVLCIGVENDLLARIARVFDVRALAPQLKELRRASPQHYDLVLLGNQSGPEALELLDELYTVDRRVPFILLAVGLDEAFERSARKLGARCLPDSVSQRELVEAIRQQTLVAQRNRRNTPSSRTVLESIPSSVVKNEFGRVLDKVLVGGRVAITRHRVPRAVLISFDEYERLAGTAEPRLDELAARFDALLARMQTPEARAGAATAFAMSPDELGRAAADAALDDADTDE